MASDGPPPGSHECAWRPPPPRRASGSSMASGPSSCRHRGEAEGEVLGVLSSSRSRIGPFERIRPRPCEGGLRRGTGWRNAFYRDCRSGAGKAVARYVSVAQTLLSARGATLRTGPVGLAPLSAAFGGAQAGVPAPHQAAPHQAAPHEATPHQAAPHEATPHQATRIEAAPHVPLPLTSPLRARIVTQNRPSDRFVLQHAFPSPASRLARKESLP
jgi:hypothetical protein